MRMQGPNYAEGLVICCFSSMYIWACSVVLFPSPIMISKDIYFSAFLITKFDAQILDNPISFMVPRQTITSSLVPMPQNAKY